MGHPPEDDDARRAALQQEILDARTVLTGLKTEIAEAQGALADTEAQRLLAANEQLVLALLHAQQELAASASALDALNRSVDRDALTRLPTRTLLSDRFAQAAANARRHGEKMALLFVDLDDFKEINDSLGHAAGDEVLVEVASRLVRNVRQSDTVSRHGGDEFLVLLSEVAGGRDAGAIAYKLLDAIAEPLVVHGHALQIGASIGIALYPDDATTEEALIDGADEAMYRAKRRSGSSCEFHAAGSPAASAAAQPQVGRPRSRLRLALQEQEQRNLQLREANEQLVLAALGAHQLKEAADRALARHQEYLALLGHEIRSPLSPLRYAADILARGPHGEAALARLRQMIQRQVMQIARLVDDMLALARATRAQLDVTFDEVDVVALAGEAVAACLPSIEGRRQTLTLSSDAPVQPLRADSVRVVQFITNLIDNASKYTPANGQIGVHVGGDATEVTVRVRDSGMGISPDALKTLFDPFVRAPEALASGSTGMGIGLTVVKELVTAHHGTVEARSDGPGRGAEFLVRLPRGRQGVGPLPAGGPG